MSRQLHGHPNVVTDSIEIRGEERKTLYCDRCGHHIPRDEPEKFADVNCDHYAELREKVMGGVNEALSS